MSFFCRYEKVLIWYVRVFRLEFKTWRMIGRETNCNCSSFVWLVCQGPDKLVLVFKCLSFLLYAFLHCLLRYKLRYPCKEKPRKQTFNFSSLIAAERRFARRNVCDSTTKIPYWWRKICSEFGRKRWLDDGVVTLFWLLFTNDRQNTKGYKGQM